MERVHAEGMQLSFMKVVLSTFIRQWLLRIALAWCGDQLSEELARAALRGFFRAPSSFQDMSNPGRRAAVLAVRTVLRS
jgi:hypothetical protein